MVSRPIEWRPEARAKLVTVLEYIVERNVEAAKERSEERRVGKECPV